VCVCVCVSVCLSVCDATTLTTTTIASSCDYIISLYAAVLDPGKYATEVYPSEEPLFIII